MENQPNDNRKKSLIWTLSVQILLIIVLYFSIAWKEPFPPIPEYGIELSIWNDTGASSASLQASEEQSLPKEIESETENSQEVDDNIQEDITEIDQSSQEVSAEQIIEEEVTEDQELIEEIEDTPVIEKQIEASKTESSKKLETEEISKPKEEVQSATIKSDTTGDSQSKGPVIDERALYGQSQKSENEGGIQLQLAGFQLYQKPEINDTSSESGKISYKITVDEEGYIIGTELVESTVKPATELIYRRAVQKLVLEKTTVNAPPKSSGTITFIIKSN